MSKQPEPQSSRRDVLVLGAMAVVAPFTSRASVVSHERPQDVESMIASNARPSSPFTIVLGIAQDGGVPQAGSFGDARWNDATQRRHVVSLGIVDPTSGKRWLIDATPDFPRQLLKLHRISGGTARPAVDGVFLTHAHVGHYPGLMYLGKEAIGATKVPTYAMTRMRAFLEKNGPWSQLVTLGNIELKPLVADEPVELVAGLRVMPMLVPHRGEFSETVAFRIDLPGGKRVLWLPDIDTWREWDAMGTRLEDVLASVDVAYLDGCFFADGELPGRDMSKIPHPPIMETITRLATLPASERAKVRFIHLNHTNPALDPSSDAARVIRDAGMRVAEEGEIVAPPNE